MTEEQARANNLEITPFTQETDVQSYLNVTEQQASRMSEKEYLEKVEIRKSYDKIKEKLGEEISDDVALGGAMMMPLLSKVTGKTIEDLLDNDIFISIADENQIKQWAEAQGIDSELVGTGAITPTTKDGKRVFNITLSKNATASTLLHELAHAVRMMATEEQMQGFAEAYGISLDQLMNEETWTKDNNALDERFANELKVYLETGKAPNKQLEGFPSFYPLESKN